MNSNNNPTCSASVFDATQSIPNLAEEQIKSCLENITVLNCKEIDALRHCIINDIESYKSTSEWHDIKRILNTPPFTKVSVSSEVSDKAEELDRFVTTYESYKKKDCEYYECTDFPCHALSVENLTIAMLCLAKKNCDSSFIRDAVNEASRKARQENLHKPPHERKHFNRQEFKDTFNPKQLCEEPGFTKKYKKQFNWEIRHLASSYRQIIRGFSMYIENTEEDHRQRRMYYAVGAMPLYHLKSIEFTDAVISLYHHTNHKRRNDAYGLLLAMRENVSKPTSSQVVSTADNIEFLSDEKYFSFGIESFHGDEDKYFEDSEKLYQAAVDNDATQVKDILFEEFSDFETTTAIKISRALDRNAKEHNNMRNAKRFDDVWNEVYNYVIKTLQRDYKTAENQTEAPWCYYDAICDREEVERRVEIVDKELIQTLIPILVQTHGKYRSLLYKLIYMLNYLKDQLGYVRSATKNYDSSRFDEDKTVEEVIRFLEPILNNDIINPRAFSVDGFIGVIKKALKHEKFRPYLDKNIKWYSKNGVNFSIPVVYQILVCLLYREKEADNFERGLPYLVTLTSGPVFLVDTPAELSWAILKDKGIFKSSKSDSWRRQMRLPLETDRKTVTSIAEEIHEIDPYRLS